MAKHIKELPNDLRDLIYTFMGYKEDFDKVLKELIKFDVYNEWEGKHNKVFYGMHWTGLYTYGYIWCRGTSMWFTQHDYDIQVENLMLVINYIDGKTTYPYANGMFGEPETEHLIWSVTYGNLSFLKGDIRVRDELIRVDKIAKRYHVTQWWI